MFSFLLDHFKIETARRTLLISSFFTLVIPSLTVTGAGINVFGLTIAYDATGFLALNRFATCYFLWIFIWLFIEQITDKTTKTTSSYFSKISQLAREQAKAMDDEVHGPLHDFNDYESWWQTAINAEAKSNKIGKMTNFIATCVKETVAIVVGGLTPIILGLAAATNPIYFNNWVLSYLTD